MTRLRGPLKAYMSGVGDYHDTHVRYYKKESSSKHTSFAAVSASTDTPLAGIDKFDRFLDLPREIRDNIYACLIDGLMTKGEANCKYVMDQYLGATNLLSMTVPAILCTSRQVRKEALSVLCAHGTSIVEWFTQDQPSHILLALSETMVSTGRIDRLISEHGGHYGVALASDGSYLDDQSYGPIVPASDPDYQTALDLIEARRGYRAAALSISICTTPRMWLSEDETANLHIKKLILQMGDWPATYMVCPETAAWLLVYGFYLQIEVQKGCVHVRFVNGGELAGDNMDNAPFYVTQAEACSRAEQAAKAVRARYDDGFSGFTLAEVREIAHGFLEWCPNIAPPI